MALREAKFGNYCDVMTWIWSLFLNQILLLIWGDLFSAFVCLYQGRICSFWVLVIDVFDLVSVKG